jgi:hypothetical protein
MGSAPATAGSNRILALLAGLAVVLFVALTIASAKSERPVVDEGLFADPGTNLWQNGSMGSRLVDDRRLKGIHQRTYWIHPLHLIAQSVWYSAVGFSLFSLRALSIFWGLVALGSWFVLARHLLTSYPSAALLGLALTAVDYHFLVGASSGRMDMMAAALGFAALAVFVTLRESHLGLAIFFSHTLTMLSGLTHPNGILHFAALVILTLHLERKRVQWQHAIYAAIPYLAGGLAWGSYILQSPSDFVAQYSANAGDGDRFRALREPWNALLMEWERYKQAFGMGSHSAGHSGPIRLKAVILAIYVSGLLGVLGASALRRGTEPRVLLWMFAASFVLLTFIDGQKAYYYLVHLAPYYATFVALVIRNLWVKHGAAARVLAGGVIGGMLVLQAGGVAYRARNDTYTNGYLPAIQFVKQNHVPGQRVWASPAFGFDLGFNTEILTDDGEIGYRTGLRTEFILLDQEMQANVDSRRNSGFGRYVERLLQDEYTLVHDHLGFRVYRRRSGSVQPTAARTL